MTHQRFNPHPHFTREVIRQGFLGEKKLVIYDIGAGGGIGDQWAVLQSNKMVIGFEPQLNDNEKEMAKRGGYFIYPVAIGDGKTHKFYVTAHWPSSGICKPNVDFWSRFPNLEYFDIKKELEIKTVTLDAFSEEKKIRDLDFIKIDVEGFELNVLENATSVLKNCIGIDTEVAFDSRLHIDRAEFSQIDSFLKKQGFTLFDLTICRYNRSTLSPIDRPIVHSSDNGQVIAGDALYLRDFKNGANADLFADPDKVIKTILLAEIYNLNDYSLELLDYFSQKKLISDHIKNLEDLLIPLHQGEKITRAEYEALFALNKKKFN